MRIVGAFALLAALPAWPQVATLTVPAAPSAHQLDVESFEKVWTTIRDKHWEKNPGGLDWQAIHQEFRPRIEKSANIDETRAILKEMLGRLRQTHFAILPATVYSSVQDFEAMGDGSSGIDLRVLDGAPVVTRVDSGSPAERAGVKPGWVILTVNGFNLDAAAKALSADSTIPEIVYTRVLLARLSGAIGSTIKLAFDVSEQGGIDSHRELSIALAAPRGTPASFGNLPAEPVWFESREIHEGAVNARYIAFNYFLDLPRLMPAFGDAVKACGSCAGLVIDLRGNPGGLGAMAMGMAGYLLDRQGLRLGTMYTRDAQLNFAINPRFPSYDGKVAVLLDGNSASTSEIFAGGLKDLGRARIFGTRSAAAALPSVIDKLPNGDGFQYAVGNYVSQGGKPLEGEGVTPDVEVKLTRSALLTGKDPVIEAALQWMETK